jgi:hypothetical protein
MTDELAAIEARHVEDTWPLRLRCREDHNDWPCDTHEAFAALHAEQEARERVEARIIERVTALVPVRYNLGPIFQPDAVDRGHVLKIIHDQFRRAALAPDASEGEPNAADH